MSSDLDIKNQTKNSIEYFDPEELEKAAAANDEFLINPLFEPLFVDHLDQHMYYQVYGGRGSGKSTAVAVSMVELTYSKYDHRILYLRATMTSMEDSSIEDIRTAIKELGLTRDFLEKKGKIINKITGNTISFKGIRSSGSATANLKSLSGITTVVFEEAEEIKDFEEFSMIDEGIRKKGVPLKIIMIYNPTSALSSWIHRQWFTEGQPKQDRANSDTVFIHSTYLDNLENLNQKKIDSYERLKITDPVYYRNTILAEWTLEAQNRIYPDWEVYNGDIKEVGDEWYGLDFGYGGNDDTACVRIRWIDGKYYVRTMFSENKLTIKKMLKLLKEAGIKSHDRIYADYAMPLLISEVRDGGFKGIRKCRKGKVEAEVKKVQDKDIVIASTKKDPIYYHGMTWSMTKGVIKDHEPDILAAMRYGINSHRPSKTRGSGRTSTAAPRRSRSQGYGGTRLH